MITLCVFTDGRDHIYDTIPSAVEHLQGPITRRIIYDDSGDPLNRHRLADAFPTFTVAHSPEGRLGFGGAIRFMWRHLIAHDPNPFIWHLEDDFLFRRDVDLNAMIRVMDERPALVQLALRRQPWNAAERAAGGIVEQTPNEFIDCHDGVNDWLEHTKFFTTNPCMYRRSLCAQGWPADPYSEGRFGMLLRQLYQGCTFGYWGARASGEWVEHIGAERVGTGY